MKSSEILKEILTIAEENLNYYVPATFEDLKNGTDVQLDACIKYLLNEKRVDI